MTTSPMILLILDQLQDILLQQQIGTYFVGGCVRDLLLGRPLHDLDLVVAGDAADLARLVARAFHAAFVLLDDENDIARVVLRGKDGQPANKLDFARMRGNDLQADLLARDLTINAIAMTPAAFRSFVSEETTQPELVDPTGGQNDLQAGLLRAVSSQALRDDPLRTMRAVRFAAELDFAIEPETAQWIRDSAGLLPTVSWERIRDELARLLACLHAAPYLPLLDNLELLSQALPELEPAREAPGLDHLWEKVCCLEWMAAVLADRTPTGPEGPLWQPAALQAHPDLPLNLPYKAHLRRYLEGRISGERSRLVLLKLATLLRYGNDRPEDRSRTARKIAQRLRLSARETLSLGIAAVFWTDPSRETTGEPSRRAVYRLYRDAGKTATGVLLLSLADDLAAAGPHLERGWWEDRVSHVGRILTLRYERTAEVIDPPRLIDGSELMETLGLEPGPLIGDLLEGIREAQAEGEVRTREEALAWARQASEQAESA